MLKSLQKSFGGDVVRFDEALKVAKESFDEEAKMISQKQAMMAKMGEDIYKKMCKKIDTKIRNTEKAKSLHQREWSL